jgi:hypothetical protein
MLPTYDNLDRVTPEDIQALIDGAVAEDERIEFKGDSIYDAKGPDWCKDISAMANNVGGCIVLGIDERDRIATEIVGVTGELDQRLLRLRQIADASIRPRIAYRETVIRTGDGKAVILLAARKSRVGPHMEMQSKRVWKRNPAGNEIMDVDDLRRAFLFSQSEEEIAFAAHAEHESAFIPGPHELGYSLSWIPAGDRGEIFDPASVQSGSKLESIGIRMASQARPRIGFDGWHCHEIGSSERFSVLRNGSFLFRHVRSDRVQLPGAFGPNDHEYDTAIGHIELATKLRDWMRLAREVYEYLDVNGPWFAFMSLTGCKGRALTGSAYSDPSPIEHDRLHLPGVPLESTQVDWFESAVVWLDRIWNACGLPRCPIRKPESGEIDLGRLERMV